MAKFYVTPAHEADVLRACREAYRAGRKARRDGLGISRFRSSAVSRALGRIGAPWEYDRVTLAYDLGWWDEGRPTPRAWWYADDDEK